MKRNTYVCVPCRFVSRSQAVCVTCHQPMFFLKQNAPAKHDDNGWKALVKYYEARPWLTRINNV